MRKTLWSRGYRLLIGLLAEVRHEAGLKQWELAARLKRPKSYVSKIERGERKIDPEECAEWAQACGTTPQIFFVRFARARERRP